MCYIKLFVLIFEGFCKSHSFKYNEKGKWEVMKLGGQYHTYDAIGKGYGAIRKTYFFNMLSYVGRLFEKAFLTKIATNKCLDILKSKRRKEMPAEDDILENNVGTVSSVEEAFLEEEINQELINACRDLKPPYNEVAYEFYCCDKTAREIAERRGIKLKTIQTQISRAKKMLQKKLKGGRYGTYN